MTIARSRRRISAVRLAALARSLLGALSAYAFFRFRPRRVKIFDEQELGPGVFVTANVGRGGAPTWARTEVYRRDAG